MLLRFWLPYGGRTLLLALLLTGVWAGLDLVSPTPHKRTPPSTPTVWAATWGAVAWTFIGGMASLVVRAGAELIVHPESARFVVLVPVLVPVALWHVAPIAATLGVFQGVWRSPKGALTGSVVGVLGALPALHRVEVLPLWEVISSGVAAVAAGGCAGAFMARGIRARGVSLPWTVGRAVTFVALWTVIAGVEGATLGRCMLARIGPEDLSSKDVSEIPPGSARGSTLSGLYLIIWRDVETTRRDGCYATVIQREGALTIDCRNRWASTSTQFSGGVDADGRFRAGLADAIREPGEVVPSEIRQRITGQFTGDSVVGVQIFWQYKHPDFVHSYLSRGAGRRCPSLDIASCPLLSTATF